ncbi:sarcosine oxidase subunit delta [Amorphus sp. MBR-141]
MFLIPCPYCGTRDQSEYAYGGQAHVARPKDPASLTDAEWAEFVFFRDNPKGLFAERWNHASGCRRWFNVLRSTASDRIYAAYAIGTPPPAIEGDRPATPSGEVVGSGNDAVKLVSAPGQQGARP